MILLNIKTSHPVKTALFVVSLFISSSLWAQVKIGDNPSSINANSLLELESSDKGVLIPRIALSSSSSASPLSAHVSGMVVYNTATSGSGTTAVSPGFYYNDGSQWVKVADSNGLDTTDDAWENVSGSRIELGKKSDGTARDANTEFVALDNGNVGIGTASPIMDLNIQKNTNTFNTGIFIRNTSEGVSAGSIIHLYTGTSSSFNGGFISAWGENFATADLQGRLEMRARGAKGLLLTTSSSSNDADIAFRTNSISRMIIKNTTGNVGIGTTTPTAKLQVYSEETSLPYLSLKGQSTERSSLNFYPMQHGGSSPLFPSVLSTASKFGVLVEGPADGNLVFKLRNNDNTDGFYFVNTDGDKVGLSVRPETEQVGIGISEPLNTLHVSKNIEGASTPNASEFVVKFENNANPVSATAPVVWIQGGQNTYSSNSELIRFARPNGSRIGGVRQTGTTTVAYTTTSDGRLKTNVKKLTNGIAMVNSMSPVSFNWKTDPKGKSEIGFIAQELYKVYPDAVIKGDDQDINNTYQVDYSKLTPILVQAVKEQQQLIKQLNNDNEILKERLEKLEEMLGKIIEER